MAEGRPNIVFIMADDMGYGDVGCFGATKIPTPNMDRVAAEGVRFTDAHSSSAVCTPSRYSVLTGRYCWRSDLKRWVLGGFGAPLIERERPTVASFLKDHGYATFGVGKWHVGLGWTRESGALDGMSEEEAREAAGAGFDVDYAARLEGGPVDLGFDRYFGIAGSLDMPPYCFIENDRVVGTPDREKEHYYNQQRRGMQAPGWKDEEVDVTFARKACEFIEEHASANPEQPFFLYVPTASPHRPCDIRPDFVKGKSEAGDRGDMVVLFDWVVGQVLGALDKLGIADETLVIVTSDNGARAICADGNDYGHRSCGDLRGQKADIWEGGHREPFVARWPARVAAGSTAEATACLGDLFATVAEIVDEPLPEGAAEDSFSLLPALTGAAATGPARDHVIHHSGNGMFSVRAGEWKLCAGLGSGGFSEPKSGTSVSGGPDGQLYDLAADPAETRNVWLEHPDVVERLMGVLEKAQADGRTRP